MKSDSNLSCRVDGAFNVQSLAVRNGLSAPSALDPLWAYAGKCNPNENPVACDLRVHKPYIDAITYASPFADGARMQRVSEVIDCWYDSGSLPFAQWGYPHQNRERFEEQFPADFISEANSRRNLRSRFT